MTLLTQKAHLWRRAIQTSIQLACIGAAAGQQARKRFGGCGCTRPVLVLLHALQGLCQGRPQLADCLARSTVRQTLQLSGGVQSHALRLQITLHCRVGAQPRSPCQRLVVLRGQPLLQLLLTQLVEMVKADLAGHTTSRLKLYGKQACE